MALHPPVTEVSQDLDASFCGKIPLHQTNLVQPQGALLVVEKKTMKVVQVSGNAIELFGGGYEELIGRPVADLFANETLSQLESIGRLQYAVPADLVFKSGFNVEKAFALVHEKQGCLLIEAEMPGYASGAAGGFNHFFSQVQNILSAINSCVSVQEVADVAAKEIKKVSGFDKVMIYSFDEEWIGSVIAEAMEEGMDSYLGLRFPSSDVPKQARDLYLKNPYRIIPNREYTGVPLYPEINSITNAPTDLSDCRFRSVVAVHLEYLKNMNVMASMSTRIIHKEQLWGLIACHHRTPKYLSFQECSFFEFLSNIISSKIASLLYKVSSAREENLQKQYADIIQRVYGEASLFASLVELKNQLLLLFDADGIAVCWDGQVSVAGSTPGEKEIRSLQHWLSAQPLTKTTALTDLPRRYAGAQAFAEAASGVLVLPIQPYEENYILAFRREVIKKVNWGGNPNQVLSFEPNTTNYHPRNSFALWQETVRHTAEPWFKEHLEIAEKCRVALVEFTLRQLTATLEQEVQKRTEELSESKTQLEKTYYELMQMLHVTSHDLREPARKVEFFGSILRKYVVDKEGASYLERALLSSNRISTLIRSLVSYSGLSQPLEKVPTDLNAIVSEVLNDFELVVAEKRACIDVGELPRIAAAPDQMRQVFHSLIDNSLKFSEAGVQIKIHAELQPGADGKEIWKIVIADTGIGFDAAYAEYIFGMFKKGHVNGYEGPGIGLTIAKKIIENHGGSLVAQGQPEKGAQFIITLPPGEA